MGTPESNLRVPSVAGIARQRKVWSNACDRLARIVRFALPVARFWQTRGASYPIRKGNLGFNHESVYRQLQATE